MTTIERDDTVRFVGKRAHWVVTGIDGDHLDVLYERKSGRDTIIRQRTVLRDRVELVRKGNKVDDVVNELLKEMP